MTIKPTIAIDGPSAAGKGTLARTIAEHLNYAFMDTGALYRASALELLNAGGLPSDTEAAVKSAQTLSNKITAADKPADILNNPNLRTNKVGQTASKMAANTNVRAALNDLQQNFAKTPGDAYNGAVLDGRDIGTVICPNADVKLFITASTEIRAERRYKELQNKGIPVTNAEVLRDMRERDERDSQRAVAPLKPADDAITLDTSALSESQAFDKAMKIINQTIKKDV